MGERPRDKNGRFTTQLDTEDSVAVFTSTGPGTCGFKSLIMTVTPGVMGEEKGKRIRFVNGIYKTSDPEEIKFLKWKEQHPRPFSKIKCVQEAKIEEKEVN